MAACSLFEFPGRTPHVDQKGGGQRWFEVRGNNIDLWDYNEKLRTTRFQSFDPGREVDPFSDEFGCCIQCIPCTSKLKIKGFQISLEIILFEVRFSQLTSLSLSLSPGKCTCWSGRNPLPTSVVPNVLQIASMLSYPTGTWRNYHRHPPKTSGNFSTRFPDYPNFHFDGHRQTHFHRSFTPLPKFSIPPSYSHPKEPSIRH